MQNSIDYIGVGTGSLIFNDHGQVFIAKRGPKARNESGKWDFPGGSVEFGEKCEDAIVREIKEEFDIDIEIIEMLEVVDHILIREGQHWVSPTFIAKYVQGKPVIQEPEKCIGIKWIYFNEIDPSDLTSSSRVNYHTYKDKYIKKIKK